MTLSELEALLKTVAPDAVYHYGAPPETPRCIVWAEYGTVDLVGDDVAQIQIPLVQIDVFTQTEGDSLADDVLAVLARGGQYCSVIGVEYDDEIMSLRTILQLQLV